MITSLVVDDDRAILTLVGTIAPAEGFDVATTVDGADAMNQLRQRRAGLVLVDPRMPGVSGLDVLRAILAINRRTDVVLMSGFATIDSAVEAVTLGARDYLTKPFDRRSRASARAPGAGDRVNSGIPKVDQ